MCDYKDTVWIASQTDTANSGCVSLGKSENKFVIPDHIDPSTPKKRKIRKRIILS